MQLTRKAAPGPKSDGPKSDGLKSDGLGPAALLSLGLAAFPQTARAQTTALTLSNDGLVQTARQYNAFNGVTTPQPGYSDGFRFTLSAPVVVTGLGYYDDNNAAQPQPAGGTAMTQAHPVGLYRVTGVGDTLLLSATVTNTDPAYDAVTGTFTAAPASDPNPLFRCSGAFTGTALLPAGTYDLMGYTGSDDYYTQLNSVVNAASGVSYVQDEYSDPTGGLAAPTGSDGPGANGIFGPDFRFTPVPPAPEPSSLAALALGGLGTAGLRLKARRRPR